MQSSTATSKGTRGRRVARGRRRLAAVLAGLALAATGAALAADDAVASSPKPGAKNVIVMISDGMGYNQMLAGDYYQYGRTGMQTYQKFPVASAMSTYSYYGAYDPAQAWGLFSYVKGMWTDSAAAATAMSTGVKTYDAGIGVDVNEEPLYHVAQRAEALGKSTGVVTSVEWSHATPAGFVAHNVSRNDYAGIANEMITRRPPTSSWAPAPALHRQRDPVRRRHRAPTGMSAARPRGRRSCTAPPAATPTATATPTAGH